MQHHPRSAPQYLDKKVMDDLSELRRGRSPLEINFEAQRDEESWMPAHELLRQVKAKSLSVKISKNDPNTARVNWQLADGEFLTVEIPRYVLERFMVQAKRAIEEAPLLSRGRGLTK